MWEVHPELPLGLNLNSQNGTITGSPGTIDPSGTDYTFYANNTAGSTSLTINIAILLDSDGDLAPDSSDEDDDNDGVLDADDAFPLDPSETSDTDGDGVGDNSDGDDDGVTDGDDDSDPARLDTDLVGPPPQRLTTTRMGARTRARTWTTTTTRWASRTRRLRDWRPWLDLHPSD